MKQLNIPRMKRQFKSLRKTRRKQLKNRQPTGQTLRDLIHHIHQKGLRKVNPSEFFITTGPGALPDQYYACIMAPYARATNGYQLIAKCNYGFATQAEALADAAIHHPLLPILSGTEEFFYPAYEEYVRQITSETTKQMIVPIIKPTDPYDDIPGYKELMDGTDTTEKVIDAKNQTNGHE